MANKNVVFLISSEIYLKLLKLACSTFFEEKLAGISCL